ncbi:MAG: NAD(P)H-binding protein [Acidimicrobiales bacterium]
MRVLVTGATGFVGARLCRALEADGHQVTAMTRRPEAYGGAGIAVGADIGDPASLQAALAGQEAAYYLVHSLDVADFADRDRRGAASFGEAAATAGVRQVIYLGGLGEEADDLSAHLRSRREVEGVLASRIPTTVLRAGIVIGDGGISWEILCQLIERLPVMITPRWVQTRCQPIGIDDALAFLVGVLDRPDCLGEIYDIGGPDPLTYRKMLEVVARLSGHRRLIVPVPVLSPSLSSHWLRLITNVDLATARALVDSMTNEVIVHDHRIEDVVGRRAMGFADAARLALTDRQDRLRADAPS